MATKSDKDEMVSILTKAKGNLDNTVKEYMEEWDKINSAFKSVDEDLKEVQTNRENLMKVSEIDRFYKDLHNTKEAAKDYNSAVEDIPWKIGKDCDSVISDVRLHGLESTKLERFVNDLEKQIFEIETKYKIFKESCNRLVGSSYVAARKLDNLADEEESKAKETAVVGGAATVGVAAVGTIASVAVGIATLGVGFVVGLPLTLVATGVATIATYVHYRSCAKSMRNIGGAFCRLGDKHFSSLNDYIRQIKQVQKYADRDIISEFKSLSVKKQKQNMKQPNKL